MQDIVSRHRPRPGMTIVVMLVIAAVLAVLPYAAWRAFGPGGLVVPVLVVVAALALSARIVRALRRRDAQSLAWTLSDDVLHGSPGADCRIALADIVSISQGLPGRRPRSPWVDAALVVKLRDGRLLLLNLLEAEQGDVLMAELVKRCASAWTDSPSHTAREREVLHRLPWNRLVWPGGEA